MRPGGICLQEHTAPGTVIFMPVRLMRRGKPPSIVHRVDVIGVSCYTSTDLINWKYEGVSSQSAASANVSRMHARHKLGTLPLS